MKKNLFTKFLALFLTGTMLTNAGCKDYDSDIDDINKRLDDLKGTVALKTDLESLHKTQEAFNKIDFTTFLTNSGLQTKLDQTLADYPKKSELKAWLTSQEVLDLLKSKGYMSKTEIEALIASSSADAAEVATIFNNMIATQALTGKLQADVLKLIQDKLVEGKFVTEDQMKSFVEGKGYMTGASSLSATQLNQMLTAVAGSVSDNTSAVRTELDKWLGEEFSGYMEDYMDKEAFKAAVGTSATPAVLEALENENSAFAKKVQGLIETAIQGQDFTAYAKAADLKTLQDSYNRQVSAIWDAIGNLASRIQSLVFVPETVDTNTAYFAGQTLGGKELVDPRFELTFSVSPAILAEKIAEKAVLISKSVTRAAVPTIFGKPVGNNTTGEIKLVITDVAANYDATKAMAVALKIQDGAASTNPGQAEGTTDDTQVNTGIDFTTAYVALVTKTSAAIDDNFVLVNKQTGKAHDGRKVIYELDYTLADAVTIMGDYEVKYKDGENLIAINGDETTPGAVQKYNWSTVPAVVWENTVAKFGGKSTDFATAGTNYGAAADLANSVFKQPAFVPTTTANKGREIAVQLKETGKTGSIDKAFYLKRTVKVQLGANAPVALKAGTFEGQVNIIKHSLGDFNFDLFINWNYTNWKQGYDAPSDWSGIAYTPATAADGTGKSYVTLTPGKLSVAQFNALAASANGWTIKDKANFKPEADAADGLDITAVPFNKVVEPTDAQTLKFTVKNYRNGYGPVVIEKTIDSGDGETITVTATLNFAQPFAGADPSVTLVSEIPFSTAAQAITPKNWIKALYAANTTLPKFGFAAEAQLIEYIDLLTPDCNCDEAGLELGTHPEYNATSHSLDVTLASVDFTNVEGSYFTTTLTMANEKAPFGINFGEDHKISVTKPAAALLAQQWQYGEKAWGLNPVNNSDKYEVKAVELLNYYNAKAADVTRKVVFSVVTDGMSAADKAEAQKASISGDNKLNWGACNLTSLKMKASLVSLDGTSTFDAVEFPIDLKTPISVAAIANRPAAEIKQTLTAGGEQTIKLVNMLTWKDINGNEVIDQANNSFVSKFAAAGCYNLPAIDWSKATVALTSGGASLPNTPLTLGADGTIKYNITNIDATKTYQVTVSGIIMGARYNSLKKDVSISFQLAPKAN